VKSIILLIGLVLSFQSWCDPESASVEAKVQTDLESALSRMIPSDQFLVQVTAQSIVKSERKIVEGEALVTTAEPTIPLVPPMPGFAPQYQSKSVQGPGQTRQIFRLVERPVLSSVRAHVTFDEELDGAMVIRAKQVVQSYLKSNYPKLGFPEFTKVAMLKPLRVAPLASLPKDEGRAPQSENKIDEPSPFKQPEPLIKNEIVWGAFAFLAVVTLLLLVNLWMSGKTMALASEKATSLPPTNGYPGLQWFGFPQPDALPKAQKNETPESGFSEARLEMIESFLKHPVAFRQYFEKISSGDQDELARNLNGPAFLELCEQMRLQPPVSQTESAGTDLTAIRKHSQAFQEFCKAKEWESKQFFGFLNELSEQQLVTLFSRENPQRIAVMLRFMKPHQSALVLEALGQESRLKVIQFANQVQNLPWNEMLTIEKEVRTIVQKVPLSAQTSTKDEVSFWGDVISESLDQESMIKDIENTRPEISRNLMRFKFKLEDAPFLPSELVEKVVLETDNDKLCLALSTCSAEVTEQVLSKMNPKRREVIVQQLVTYAHSSTEQKIQARLELTRKFREAMAA
jgi:hypothetical protein